jgi:hypothetical protein
MDRRSWLWRRKSSEKSPGETESTGSVSSHSERFSDDQVTLFCNAFVTLCDCGEILELIILIVLFGFVICV